MESAKDIARHKSRRSILKGTAAGMIGGVGLLTLSGGEEAQATTLSALDERKCATCRYWGGVRKISKDGSSIDAEGTGWCNNPESPAYMKRTKPEQGAPTWVRWDALTDTE